MTSVLEELLAHRPDGEDPKAFIKTARGCRAMFTREKLQELLHEIKARLGSEQLKAYESTCVAKSAPERWMRFLAILDETGLESTGPTLLPAGSLDLQLDWYSRYIHHANDCWFQARDCFRVERYAFSAFFSILTLEETGKLSTLWIELLNYDAPRGPIPTRKDPRYHHKKKYIMAACQGALVNSRLDHLLGIPDLKEYLAKAESGDLEKLRQGCLYTGVGTGEFPSDEVTRTVARDLCVFAGEVMADVLGNFPWEWKRMSSDVAEFEQSIGFAAAEQDDEAVDPAVGPSV